MAEFHDGPHATPAPATQGPVFLGIRNITEGGRLDLTDVRHISDADFPRWTRRVTPQGDDVVFTYEATLHRYALIPSGFRGCLGRRLALIRPDRSEVVPRFLHFLFLGAAWKETITERIISGSTVDRIPLIDFPDFPVRIPDVGYQHKVVQFLGSIDDLIENNRRRIELLEQMAQAIYREWFVHFRYPGHENDELVDSTLGPIPSGWSASSVGAITAFLSRGISPKYDDQGPTTVVNQKCVRAGRLSMTPARRQSKTIPTKKCLRFGDVLINSTGVGTLGRVAQVYEDVPLDTVTADSHVTIVRPKPDIQRDFFGTTLLNQAEAFAAMGVGSTGQTELSRASIGDHPLLLPPTSVQLAFGDVVSPMRCLARTLGDQATALERMRDLLLPKLVTGEIDVSTLDLEGVLEKAGV